MSLLGCSIDFLKFYFEWYFQYNNNINWDNYGKYWHIYHVKPCCSFNLEDEHEQRLMCNWSNLRPLEKTANIRKGGKYNDEIEVDYMTKLLQFFSFLKKNHSTLAKDITDN